MTVNTPPLGWNTWNTFGPDINEKLIMESVDAMVESGLRDVGYEYIVIDDVWSLKKRDQNGKLVPDPKKFPHGIKYLADYVHSKGLKFGMYSCAGTLTCAGYPGSYGHEWTDAATFAEWGVDFLKYDYCFRTAVVRPDQLYKRMSLALANCGRDILFSACSWGIDNTRYWIKETGASMWRSTGDINDSWKSIKSLAQSQLQFQEYNGKGCFNDMDMLVVGMSGMGNVASGGCTDAEYRLHFSLWALLNSPLMIGCDIRDMTPETKEILMNREIIAINQDIAGRQPFFANAHLAKFEPRKDRQPDEPFCEEYPLDAPIIAKFLDNGDIAIGIFNFTETPTDHIAASVPLDQFGIFPDSGKTLKWKDLWTGETGTAINGVFYLPTCEPHSCRMFRAKVVDAKF